MEGKQHTVQCATPKRQQAALSCMWVLGCATCHLHIDCAKLNQTVLLLQDGLLSYTMRELANTPDDNPKWILLDGDLDANWVESMNSVMDDSRLLTLPSNERIRLLPHMKMIFEIRDLKYATPVSYVQQVAHGVFAAMQVLLVSCLPACGSTCVSCARFPVCVLAFRPRPPVLVSSTSAKGVSGTTWCRAGCRG